jgi:hypothetical protein
MMSDGTWSHSRPSCGPIQKSDLPASQEHLSNELLLFSSQSALRLWMRSSPFQSPLLRRAFPERANAFFSCLTSIPRTSAKSQRSNRKSQKSLPDQFDLCWVFFLVLPITLLWAGASVSLALAASHLSHFANLPIANSAFSRTCCHSHAVWCHCHGSLRTSFQIGVTEFRGFCTFSFRLTENH